jgi:hypothetical protein
MRVQRSSERPLGAIHYPPAVLGAGPPVRHHRGFLDVAGASADWSMSSFPGPGLAIRVLGEVTEERHPARGRCHRAGRHRVTHHQGDRPSRSCPRRARWIKWMSGRYFRVGPPEQILVGAIRTCMGSVGALNIRECQGADAAPRRRRGTSTTSKVFRRAHRLGSGVYVDAGRART